MSEDAPIFTIRTQGHTKTVSVERKPERLTNKNATPSLDISRAAYLIDAYDLVSEGASKSARASSYGKALRRGDKTSILAGVRKHGKAWGASIRHWRQTQRRLLWLGTYATEREAGLSYDVALMLLGEEPRNFSRDILNTLSSTFINAVRERLGLPTKHSKKDT